MNDAVAKGGNVRLPQVDKLLRHPTLLARQSVVRREVIAQVIRNILDDYRSGDRQPPDELDSFVAEVEAALDRLFKGNLRRVINGTGIILSTNLGRAPIHKEGVGRISEILAGYSNLELDMESGKRGERTTVLEEQLCVLTGCEAALLVNNNAAAVMLTVNALALQKEVIVSRGELIEIGGSFRLPDVIETAGGRLREVGTTNRTRIDDYRRAVGAETALFLKCHRSNFELTGFTEEAKTEELVALAKEKNTIFVEDLGSGALLDFSRLKIKHEPTVGEVISLNVDLVMFSGDKLMGGSQAGIICGKRDLIKRLRKNPMYRALRADKLTIGLLEQVLAQYLKVSPEESIPVLQMACLSTQTIYDRVQRFIKLASEISPDWQFEGTESSSTFGGGTLPGTVQDSFSLSIKYKGAARLSPDKVSALLRQAPVPVITVITGGQTLIDFRTVGIEDESSLLDSIKWVVSNGPNR